MTTRHGIHPSDVIAYQYLTNAAPADAPGDENPIRWATICPTHKPTNGWPLDENGTDIYHTVTRFDFAMTYEAERPCKCEWCGATIG